MRPYKILASLAIFLPGCFLSFGVFAEAEKVELIDFVPKPNYKLTQDANDRYQLFDGVEAKFPMWTQKQAVGWVDKDVVTIKLSIPEAERSNKAVALHIPCRMKMRVKFPEYIELYDMAKEGLLLGRQEYTEDCMKGNHWKTFSVTEMPGELKIVIKPRIFFHIDEIKLLRTYRESEEKNISISSYWPEPSYKLTTDNEDGIQLTDGKLMRHPLWVHKESVGWRRTNVVRLNLLTNERAGAYYKAKVSVHLPCKMKSGVFHPEYMAIYERSLDRVEELARRDFPEHCREGEMWADLVFESNKQELVLVVKPRNRLFLTDEILLDLQDLTTQPPVSQQNRKDPDRNLRTGQEAIAIEMIEDPYADMDRVTNSASGDYVLNGLSGDYESLAFKITNNTSDGQVVRWSKENFFSEYSFFEVKPVHSALELIVLDPLQPLYKDKISVDANSSKTLWIKVKLKTSTEGAKLHFASTGNDFKRSFTIAQRVLKCADKTAYLNAVTWGYFDKGPVCRKEPKACAQDHSRHHVNVYVIHPRLLPRIGQKVDKGRHQRLKTYVRNLPLGARLHLFVNLKAGYYKQVVKSVMEGETGVIKDVEDWLEMLTKTMAELGYPKESWALYLYDEPTNQQIEMIVKFFRIIKAYDSDIALYENPAHVKVNKLKPAFWKEFLVTADYLQPLFKEYKINKKEYKNLPGELWFYDVPPQPTKELSPHHYYKYLSFRAWHDGLKGVGFWSYDDTSNQSGWIDTDADRPDFAIVYEGKDSPVSSVRWEGFAEGLEENHLLTTYEKLKYGRRDSQPFKEKMHSIFNNPKEYQQMKYKIYDELENAGCQRQ